MDDIKPNLDRLKNLEKDIEKVTLVKRCPKCFSLSLEYDKTNKKMVCQDCGYEEKIGE